MSLDKAFKEVLRSCFVTPAEQLVSRHKGGPEISETVFLGGVKFASQTPMTPGHEKTSLVVKLNVKEKFAYFNQLSQQDKLLLISRLKQKFDIGCWTLLHDVTDDKKIHPPWRIAAQVCPENVVDIEWNDDKKELSLLVQAVGIFYK